MSLLTIQEDILYNVYFEYQKYSDFPTSQGVKIKGPSFIMYLIVKLYIDNLELKPTFVKLLGEEQMNYIQTSKNKEDIFISIGYQYQYIITRDLCVDDKRKLGTDTFLDFNQFEINFLLGIGNPLVIPNTKQQINEYNEHNKGKGRKYNKYGQINTDRLTKVIQMIEERELNEIDNVPENDVDECNLMKKLDYITELLVKQQQEINELKQMVKLIIL